MSAIEDPISVLEDAREGILHAIYDIIKCIERDSNVDEKVNQLRGRLETARSLVQSLKGTDLTPDEQLEKAEFLQIQLMDKRRLLSSYKNMCALFDLPNGQPNSNGTVNGESSHISQNETTLQ